MAADDPHLIGNAALLGIAEGCGYTGVRHGHDDVSLDRMLPGQFQAHPLAHAIDRAAVHDAVRAGEIDVFEQAGAGPAGREGLERLQALVVDDDDLTVLDITLKGRADGVQRAGFRSQHPGAAEPPQDQRTDAERVARADQLGAGGADEGIAALDPAYGVDEAINDLGLTATGDQVKDDLGVGGRLEDGPFADQLVPQIKVVGQVAVVGDGDAALIEIGEHRLDVAQEAAAGGGIAGVADSCGSGQAFRQIRSAEGLADQAHVAFGVEAGVVDAGDAAGFLAAVLKGVQAKGDDGRSRILVGPPDAADAALKPWPVVVGVTVVFPVDDRVSDGMHGTAHRGLR